MEKPKRRYGYKPSVHDIRDHLAQPGSQFYRATHVPKSFQMVEFCSQVEDQGSTSSCTANATVGAMELTERRESKDHGWIDLSRAWLYWMTRKQEGDTSHDNGAYIRDAIKVAAAKGAPPEADWAFNTYNIFATPPASLDAEAAPHRITEYARVTREAAHVKTVLASGFPIVFGMSVYDSFESSEVAKTGIVPLPTFTEKLQGGHAVLAVGYDDDKRSILVRNSWGADWGLKGYFWLSYDYFFSSLVSDLWVIRH